MYVVHVLIWTIQRIMNYKSADYCHNLWQYMTSEVLTVVVTNITISQDLKPCNLVEEPTAYIFKVKAFYPNDWGIKFFPYAGY